MIPENIFLEIAIVIALIRYKVGTTVEIFFVT